MHPSSRPGPLAGPGSLLELLDNALNVALLMLGRLLQPTFHHLSLTRKVVFQEEAIVQLTFRRIPVDIAQPRKLFFLFLILGRRVRIIVCLKNDAEKFPSVSLLLTQPEFLDLFPLPRRSGTAESHPSICSARALESAEMSLLAPFRPQLVADLPLVSRLQIFNSHLRDPLELQHQIVRSIILVLRSWEVIKKAIQSLSEDFDFFPDAVRDVSQGVCSRLGGASSGAGGGREVHVGRPRRRSFALGFTGSSDVLVVGAGRIAIEQLPGV